MTPNRLTEPKSLATNLASRIFLARMFLVAIFLTMSAVLAGITGNASAQTPTTPGSPWLTAKPASTTQIDLSWTSPSNDGGASVSEYKVEVSSDNKANWTDLKTTKYNIHSHTGLDPGTTRWYRVSAKNSVGFGAASNVVSVTTYQAPSEPKNLEVTPKDGKVKLDWDPPDQVGDNYPCCGSGFISGYEFRHTTGIVEGVKTYTEWKAIGGTFSTQGTVSGLTNYIKYEFQVRALSPTGPGPGSVVEGTPRPNGYLWFLRDGYAESSVIRGSEGTTVGLKLEQHDTAAAEKTITLEWGGEPLTGDLQGGTITIPQGEDGGQTTLTATGGTPHYHLPITKVLTASENGHVLASRDFTIFDNTSVPNVELTANTTAIDEGGSVQITVKAVPHGWVRDGVQVKLSVNDPDDAFTDNDDRMITFNSGETSKTLTFQASSNDIDNKDLSAGFKIHRPNRWPERDLYVITKQALTVRVYDDDTSSWRVNVWDAEANEEDGYIEFPVKLNDTALARLTVRYRTVAGTATEGTDYQSRSGTVTFERRDKRKVVRVPLINDNIEDNGETFELEIHDANPSDKVTIGLNRGTGTIYNTEDEEQQSDEEEETEAEEETDPFTASFSGMPDSHDGSSEFSFTLTLSEEPKSGFSYETLRDDAFEVTNGDVAKARRQETDKNQKWTIFVTPDGDDDVTVTLPPTTSCSASGAICTDDDRMLSNRNSETVEGPSEEASVVVPSISIADAEADEGEDVSFTVSLSEATTTQVSVNYATSSGSATEGTDFSEASSTLNFEAGTTSKTITVSTTEDTTDESGETFTVTLSSPSNATLGDATATGTIKDDDEPPPLTVNLKNQPQTHDGSTAFTFEIHFSEDLHDDFSYETLRDDAFNVTNGTVNKARRINPDSNTRNKSWLITVTPSGNGNTTITLPITTSCSASGAICTGDKSKLSTPVSFTVNGPGS